MKKSIIVQKVHNNSTQVSKVVYHEIDEKGKAIKEDKYVGIRQSYVTYDKENIKNTMHKFLVDLLTSQKTQKPINVDLNIKMNGEYANEWINPLNEEISLGDLEAFEAE